ncbi:unnamed protein product [Calypogeia fissa]
MEQDDEEFEQLLGEIPRATSAPPHLEELQRAYGAELSNSAFAVSVGEGGGTLPPVKPFIDIRCDEQYEDFYRAYSGAKKLPPPMENRSLYVEFPNMMSPKANSTHVSPFFSGLALDSPRTIAGLRQRQKQQEAQISVSSNSTSISVRTSSPPSDHHHHHHHPSKSSVPVDNRSLASAFANLSFEESSGGGLTVGHHREENGVGIDSRGASNGGMDHGVVVGSSLPNSRGAPISSGLYSHLNPFSSGYGSEPASLVEGFVNRSPSATMDLFSQKNAGSVSMEASSNSGSYGTLEGFDGQAAQVFEKYLRRPSPTGMENQVFSSSTRPNKGGMMDGLGTSSNAAHAAHQQQHFESAYAAAIAARIMHPGTSSPSMSGNDLYMNSGIDYNAASARALQQQAHRIQFQLEAEQRARERHYNLQQQLQHQQQQMRFYASLQAQANGASGSNSHPSSGGPSPTGTTSRQASLHQAAGVVANHLKNTRSHEQLWNVRAGFVSQNNGDAGRDSVVNSICRYYAQGYCSRGDACPFIHTAVEVFGSGRGTCGSNFKETSRDERLLADKVFPRSRISSRIGTGPAIPVANPVQRRKLESVSNGNSASMNGHIYANGSHHVPAVGCHSDLQNHNLIEETLEFNGIPHAIVGSQHLSPPNQQPKYNTLEEVEGKIFSIAKDQHGCRFLQRKFDEGGPEDVQKIFNEIIDHIIELMTDPFGNYLVQKLLEVCDEVQRMEILHVVTGKGELVTISLNMHGTRAVQKLIETLKSAEQVNMVITALKQGVVTLIKDLNGNHVVQRCLQRLSTEDSQFIFDAAAVHCVEIATHRHGCCVLQRCVDFASGSQRHCLVAEIAANALVLSQDPFGNYVVQYVLDLGMTWASIEVMVRLENHYPFLAMQKFSSNVVEKCLKLATDENRGRIVRELMGSPRLGQMLQDPYANYVVQSALTVAKGSLHTGLVEAIRPHLSVLRSSPYGKRILSRTNLKK